MRSKDLEKIVAKECEFLSYFLEDFENKLSTEPNNQEIKKHIDTLREKYEKYDKVHKFIIETFKSTNPHNDEP